MRVVLLVLFMLAQAPSAADSQQLRYTRRVFSFTPQFLKTAKTTAAPGAPAAASGSALIAFWTSERGAVVSARGIEGPAELQRAAIDAIYQWKFNPSITAEGQFVQVGSAVTVDFSKSPPAITNKPMTAALASPGFEFKCFNGLVGDDAASVNVCRQQLAAVENDSRSTPRDRFTALAQYGFILMKACREPQKAAELFSQAITLAPVGRKTSDSERA